MGSSSWDWRVHRRGYECDSWDGWPSDSSARRRERRNFADYISGQLFDMQERQMKLSCALDGINELRQHIFEMKGMMHAMLMSQSPPLQALSTRNHESHMSQTTPPKFADKLRADVGVQADDEIPQLSDSELLETTPADEWTPLIDHKVIKTGDIIKITRECWSNNNEARVRLPEGRLGRVIQIDDDGDLQVYFPEIRRRIGKEQWLIRRDHERHISIKQHQEELQEDEVLNQDGEAFETVDASVATVTSKRLAKKERERSKK
eukprot:gnl/TRDRNA2_/TRDRNA2_47216_c0_seq1.p1 gnl/TRDRNA2_/TRDRNA2_47216_c0~~gnl/TRDRNA2_/TRDRNA2_47216_c0_seq1.p1  ORF type:complete len:263 (-),score=42.67 gnl/TRDRNA2_/TRDRNA2_47216_c0_seq1:382-1170(-)